MRYAGKLLFQFRKKKGRKSNARRLCEERIVIVPARSPSAALTKLKRRGADEEYDYKDGSATIFFEFIGVTELVELGESLESDEVWWEFREILRPKERKSHLIPKPVDLRAFSVGRDRANRRRK